jgi:proline dehydrogenase
MRLLTFFARRFVAGETPADAVRVGERLAAKGILATFDLLGEHVHDRRSAERSTEAIKAFLAQVPRTLERNTSIKLSQLGLDISADLCLELTTEVLKAARAVDGFVRIDMEGSRSTGATIDIFRRLRREFENVGLVLQAALFRTWDDIQAAVEHGDRIRLCKGAYKEPAAIAWTRMEDVRKSYRRCAELLLERGAQPALATHDETLIQHALAHVATLQKPAGSFEFQMLFGLRPRRWAELARLGHKVRVYVPYGTHWIPYYYRRLRERKENVLFLLRNLLRG